MWATRARDHQLRVVLINKSQTQGKTVTVRLPPGAGTAATVERLLAPGASARSGVTLGARSYGAETRTGRLAPAQVAPATVARGRVTLSIPRASAGLVTVG